jgi:hypothetical protein
MVTNSFLSLRVIDCREGADDSGVNSEVFHRLRLDLSQDQIKVTNGPKAIVLTARLDPLLDDTEIRLCEDNQKSLGVKPGMIVTVHRSSGIDPMAKQAAQYDQTQAVEQQGPSKDVF